MRKSLTILAACGLALGAAACGKHDAGNSSANLSEADNMLVPADENAADTATADNGDATADNATMAAGNDTTGNTAGNAQ